MKSLNPLLKCNECSPEFEPCPPDRCGRIILPGTPKFSPLHDIDFKHVDGYVCYRLTRGMAVVRLTTEAAARTGASECVLNLSELEKLIASAQRS